MPPLRVVTIGLDRIDNSRGYEPGNVAPCCATCNKMKLAMEPLEFLAQCQRIVANASIAREPWPVVPPAALGPTRLPMSNACQSARRTRRSTRVDYAAEQTARIESDRGAVLAVLEARGPVTTSDVIRALPAGHRIYAKAVRSRLRELMLLGLARSYGRGPSTRYDAIKTGGA